MTAQQKDLFDAPPETDAVEKINFWESAARRIGGHPPEWKFYQFEVIDGGMLVTGGVPRYVTRGPNKGQPRWKGRGDRVLVGDAEHRAECSAYEHETGKCHKCWGTGQEFAGWSRDQGTHYRTCFRCKGTGKLPE